MTGAEPLLFALRAHLYAHPFIAIVIISLALASARKVAATTVEAGFSRPAALTLFVSWLPIALYTFAGAAYLCSPAYSDHIEPSIAAVSWYHVSGAPLYPSADAAAQYALPYGPLLYLVNGITLQLAGPSVFASKLAGLLAALLSLILLARALARRTRRVVPVVAAVALGYLAFGTMTFWARSEPLLLLLVAVSLKAGISPSGILMPIGFDEVVHMPSTVGHAVGYRNFNVKDASRNISPIAIWLAGEELHNNHHADPRSAKFKARWFELDIGWVYLRLLSFFGLAKIEYARS